MGLLDNLGALAGQLGNGQQGSTGNDPKAALVEAVLGMLVHGNEPGGLGGSGGIGGLGGLLQRFQNAGLGDAVASWVGTGANLPVSANDVKTALSAGLLRTLAEHAGIDEDQVASHLSGILPQLVDKLTPNGQVPPAGVPLGGVADLMGSLSHLFTNKPA